MKPDKSVSTDARQIALNILNRLSNERLTLDRAFEKCIQKNLIISSKDRALINTIVYGVLRWRNRLDFLIRHFSNIRFSKIDPLVLNILRMGLYQIVYLSRIPISAAVNTSVELSKKKNAPWIVKFVNALLRRASREYQDVPFPSLEGDPVSAIAVNQSFPDWLVKKWLDRHGMEKTRLLCDAFNTIAPLTIRTNALKVTRSRLLDSLANASEKPEKTRFSSDGVILKQLNRPVAALSPYTKGHFQVQDEAAQLVSYFIGPKPGEKIMDACAGLGGKTGHLAQLMENTGIILAVDHMEQKLNELNTQMKRLGITIVNTLKRDLFKPLEVNLPARFQRILLDAPCSGLGVIKRNPDTKWKSYKKDLNHFQDKQVRLLSNLSGLLDEGGILVYAVCSLEPEENEEVVNEFLTTHHEFKIDKGFGRLPDQARDLIDENGYFKTSPWKDSMDGFFAVRLRKNTPRSGFKKEKLFA